jgi:hypothetical protein
MAVSYAIGALGVLAFLAAAKALDLDRKWWP